MEQASRILIIDDEIYIRKFYETILKPCGYQLVMVESGTEALDLLAHDANFDLVLLDNLMVDMDGIDVLKAIKKDSRLSQIRVMMLSGLCDEATVEAAKVAGAIECLSKPVLPKVLLQLINQYLSRPAG
jgi:CheY-like chemotaxis protein